MNKNSDFLIEKLLIQKNCWIKKSVHFIDPIKLSKYIPNCNLFFSIGKIMGIKLAPKRASFSVLGRRCMFRREMRSKIGSLPSKRET